MPAKLEIEPRLLLGPGPSPVHERILEALARPTLGHLDPQFLRIMDEVSEGLRKVFGTRNRMTFPVSGTGSAGMEAALAKVWQPFLDASAGWIAIHSGEGQHAVESAWAEVVSGRNMPAVGHVLSVR